MNLVPRLKTMLARRAFERDIDDTVNNPSDCEYRVVLVEFQSRPVDLNEALRLAARINGRVTVEARQ